TRTAAPAPAAQWTSRDRSRPTTIPCATSSSSATRWNAPRTATEAPYATARSHDGRSRSHTSASVASTANRITNAYGRASCAYRDVVGTSANASPASTPTRTDTSRAPSTVSSAVAATIASADGSRSANVDVPTTDVHAFITAKYGPTTASTLDSSPNSGPHPSRTAPHVASSSAHSAGRV